MPVLVTAEVPGQTQEGYDGMVTALGGALRQAKGFIAHFAAPTAGGWQVMELWETPEDASRFFANHVHGVLPDGIKPKRSLTSLHTLIQP